MNVSPSRLAAALLLGVALQLVLLALGLHFDLAIPEICSVSLGCYWLANGLYFTSGLAFGILVVPWANLRLRATVSVILLSVGLVIGISSIPSLTR